MQFAPNTQLARRYRVSREGKDLVNRLLKEKEARLSCQAYVRNDLSRFRSLHQVHTVNALDGPVDTSSRFLYPDDASDIKAHPFFAGIDWDRLHLLCPPEIPFVRHELDTKYFDQGTGSEISTVSQSSSVVVGKPSVPGRSKSPVQPIREDETLFTTTNVLSPSIPPRKFGRRRLRVQKRPRDCILRDQDVSKEAMEARKAGAFMGYAYRRPSEILSFLDSIGDRQWMR
jgi:hypothetical protein